jgi:hypothetical protein
MEEGRAKCPVSAAAAAETVLQSPDNHQKDLRPGSESTLPGAAPSLLNDHHSGSPSNKADPAMGELTEHVATMPATAKKPQGQRLRGKPYMLEAAATMYFVAFCVWSVYLSS